MRHLFIINPAAGRKGSTARLEAMLERVSFPHEVMYTTGPMDAWRMSEEAARRGDPVRIYACGGDGTLNEVVNGAAGYAHVAITNVPKGTGNDFLKAFGEGYREQFFRLEELAVGPQSPMDLMDCNGRLGIDVVCAGVDARIGARVDRYKFVTGIWAYLGSLVENVIQGISRPLAVEMGDIRWDGNTTVLCICNGRHYGGGFMPMGEAEPDDGVLDMLLVPEVSRLTFMRLVKKYATGRYRDYPELIYDYHGQQVRFHAREEFPTVVDGEVMWDNDFTLRLSEKKINFFYPAGCSYRSTYSAVPEREKSTKN